MNKENKDDIVFKKLSFTYTGNQESSLKNISFIVKKGSILLITGAAGAGKTTLCRCINGLIPHFFGGEMKGDVMVKGYSTKKYDIGFFSSFIGFLFQDPSSQLIAPTILDEVAFGPENLGLDRGEILRRIKYALKMVRLEGYEDRSPHSLSGGEQQACALASIIAMDPQIYVLDEPTSNLDPIGTLNMFKLIRKLVEEEKRTTILVEHKLSEALPIADYMLVLKDGEIKLFGRPREILSRIKELKEIGLKIPHVVLIADFLRKKSIPVDQTPITLDEGVSILRKILEKKRPLPRIDDEKIDSNQKNNLIIKVEDLWYTYMPVNIEAIRGVSLDIYENEFIAIIGQNGSGKTTLVKHFNGLLKPTRGKVYVYGVDTEYAEVAELSKRVGYVFQNPDNQLFSKTVREELAFGPKNLGVKKEEIENRIKEVSMSLGLENYLNRNPMSLSKGERQKVAVASVLTMKPNVLIVDEPTTGQDYRTAKDMMEFYKRLHREGKTIIVVTHDIDLAAEYSQRIIVMWRGKVLLEGNSRKVLSQSDILEKTYIRPPQITLLFQKLSDLGAPDNIITIDEGIKYLEEILSS